MVRDGALLDLGCGQGLLAAWLSAARAAFEAGEWPDDWPAPPNVTSYLGIELMQRDVARARTALGDGARFEAGDIRTHDLHRADTIVIFDVLHYIGLSEQQAVLARVRDALNPDGVLLMRIGDAGGGFGFTCSTWVDRTAMLLRGHGWNRLHCRTLDAWRDVLVDLGFDVDVQPMNAGTPFANVLIVAKLQGDAKARRSAARSRSRE